MCVKYILITALFSTLLQGRHFFIPILPNCGATRELKAIESLQQTLILIF